MPDRKRKLKIVLLHIVMLPTLLFAFYFFTLAPRPWTGVDEAVVEKIAKEHGREARKPFIDLEGDLQLFAFLLAGVVGGFAAGYFWRKILSESRFSGLKDGQDKKVSESGFSGLKDGQDKKREGQ